MITLWTFTLLSSDLRGWALVPAAQALSHIWTGQRTVNLSRQTVGQQKDLCSKCQVSRLCSRDNINKMKTTYLL